VTYWQDREASSEGSKRRQTSEIPT